MWNENSMSYLLWGKYLATTVKQPQEVHFLVKQMKQSNPVYISEYFNKKFLNKYKKKIQT